MKPQQVKDVCIIQNDNNRNPIKKNGPGIPRNLPAKQQSPQNQQ